MPLDEPLLPLGLVVLVLPPTPVLPEVLDPLEVLPALDDAEPSSCRHFSFSAPVSESHRAEPVVALLEVDGELDVLGEVADGVDEELEPADGLELELLEVCANDAADIANSAAAVAVTRIFNVMGFSCVRVKENEGCGLTEQAPCRQ